MTNIKPTIILLIICLFCSQNSFGQIDSVDSVDFNKIVYWFGVKGKVKREKKTNKPRYFLKSIGRKPKSGTLKEFEKNMWRNLQRGNQVSIRPFYKEKDAKLALPLYQLTKNKTLKGEIFSTTSSKRKFYWFTYKFERRIKHPLFYRPHTKIREGGLKDFHKVLLEGILDATFTFGPFPTKEEATLARRIYRLEED